MVEMGGEEEGNSIQKMLAAATALTPDFAAEMLGVREVFQVSKLYCIHHFLTLWHHDLCLTAH